MNGVNPGMDGEILAALPCVLDGCRLADINDLLNCVELAHPVGLFHRVGDRIHKLNMAVVDVLDMPQPIVDQPHFLPAQRSSDSAASMVSADNDMFYPKNIDGELHDREAVQVCVHDDIGDVAMHENLTRKQTGDLVCGNPAVRTADPEILRRLLVGQVAEEPGLKRCDLARPLAIPGK